MSSYDLHHRAAAIVRDAGGKLIGRTRLQKVTYLMQLAGFGEAFPFEYRHYGPFSEDLADAMEIASGLRLVQEEEKRADWGGWYSIYTLDPSTPLDQPLDPRRVSFVRTAAGIGSIELELAATAAFLYAEEGIGRDKPGDPWDETARRKPDKAGSGRLERAREAYRLLLATDTVRPLPAIA
jgi:hypothetical protein